MLPYLENKRTRSMCSYILKNNYPVWRTCYHTWKTNEHGSCVLIPCQTNIQNAPNLIQADKYYTVKVDCNCISNLVMYSSPITDLARIQKKGVRALRGYFGPPMKSKNKSSSSQVSPFIVY